jgi:hypothetical protein
MSIDMILPCVIGFIILCGVIYNYIIPDSDLCEYRKNSARAKAANLSARDWEEFDRITYPLAFYKKKLLVAYFIITNMSIESANTFLKSYHGMAFLQSYRRCSSAIDEFKISQLILNAEKEKEIITCAVNVMKEYS